MTVYTYGGCTVIFLESTAEMNNISLTMTL